MAFGNGLLDIENVLVGQHGLNLSQFSGFELPDVDNRDFDTEITTGNQLIREQQQLNALAAERTNEFDVDSFNADQCQVYDSIMLCVERDGYESTNQARIFFVDGPGGTGKTYLFNAILNVTRSAQDGFALAVASSGTAALLLDGGRTAHSTFKIPLNVSPRSMCGVSPTSVVAELIRKTKVIVWDESSMISRAILEAVDRTFKDIFSKDDADLASVPFGGRLMVFGGDFRQVLPVIPKASRCEIVNQSLNRSFLWRYVVVKKLRINMRVQQALTDNNIALSNELQQFADMLLEVGDGRTDTLKIHDYANNCVNDTDFIKVSNSMLIAGDNVINLLSAVYPELYNSSSNSNDNLDTSASWTKSATLTPTNADCGVSRRLLEFNENKVGLFIQNEVKKSIPAALTTLFICFSILVTLD